MPVAERKPEIIDLDYRWWVGEVSECDRPFPSMCNMSKFEGDVAVCQATGIICIASAKRLGREMNKIGK